MAEPLVSVIIPTHNSQPISNSCIRFLNDATYKNIEVIVVDRLSTDGTPEIAKNFGATVIQTKSGLLGARYEGVLASKGEYVLLLDPDLMLFVSTMEKLVQSMAGCDMMCLEEESYSTRSMVDKMFVAEKELISREPILNPLEGAMEARFYRKSILEQAFSKMDMDKLRNVTEIDLAIIYYEAFKISNRVDFLPRAMMHNEPSTVKELWKKSVRRGEAIRELASKNIYPELTGKKTRVPKEKSPSSASIRSMQLSLLRGIPYTIGRIKGKQEPSGDSKDIGA
jgi:glycosyltransferase involved in cell wall biosynthesis